MKNLFIMHVEGDAETALERTLTITNSGVHKSDFYYAYTLKADKGKVSFTLDLDFISDAEANASKKHFEIAPFFVYNCNANGTMAWKYIINNLWYHLSYNENLFSDFMKDHFNCSISELHTGDF